MPPRQAQDEAQDEAQVPFQFQSQLQDEPCSNIHFSNLSYEDGLQPQSSMHLGNLPHGNVSQTGHQPPSQFHGTSNVDLRSLNYGRLQTFQPQPVVNLGNGPYGNASQTNNQLPPQFQAAYNVDLRNLEFEDVGLDWSPGIQPSSSVMVPPLRERTGWTIDDPYGSVEEGGRTYHTYRTGTYYLPNDGQEQNRLDMQHALWDLLLEGRLHLAPITQSPTHVLDVATGTGVWANDFAERNPECTVVGTDISLIQPFANPNVVWMREDSENEEWDYPSYKFDLVHFRSTIVSFTDIRRVMQQAYQNLKPGGWIEFQEAVWDVQSPDGTHFGTGMHRFTQHIAQGFAAIGRDFSLTRIQSYPALLQEVGFVDVQVKRYMVPMNGWVEWNLRMKKVGMFAALVMLDAVESYRKILGFSGLSSPEVNTLVEEVKRDCPNRDIHCAIPIHVIWGRKPFENPYP